MRTRHRVGFVLMFWGIWMIVAAPHAAWPAYCAAVGIADLVVGSVLALIP